MTSTETIYRLRPIHWLIALYVPLSAARKGSLNTQGALLAACFSITTLPICRTSVFAVSLLTFFFVGTRATKYKASVKQSLEEPDHGARSRNTAQGTIKPTSRDAKQVASNGLLGFLACLAWTARFGTSFATKPLQSAFCPVGPALTSSQDLSNALVYTAVGFFAACMGDTLASELGMLARSQPRLVTTFRPVRPGTNGGITLWGTFVSYLGGQLISAAAVLALWIETPACRTFSPQIVRLLALGGLAGLLGSFVDSLLGATVQETLYSKKRKMVVHGSMKDQWKEDEVVVLNGRDLLSNNQVNIAASWGTGLLAGYLGWTC